ncbi:hypothetical protein [Sphingomonas sp.]|uniref:hypothetical protein n=1 Tax=Sphingomonas sp. TaxID=28214 RepID=UPI003D6CE056
MGDGYEPHVDERDGALTYSLPVDSGFVSAAFSFDIRQADLDILLADPYRRAVLEVIAHTILQRSLLAGSTKVTQQAFDDLVSRALHAPSVALEEYIAEIGRDHHIVIGVYVEQAMARQSAAKA